MDDTLIQEFAADSLEHLALLRAELLTSLQPVQKENVVLSDSTHEKLRRFLQSVKVGAGYWGFDAIQQLSWELKNSLMASRWELHLEKQRLIEGLDQLSNLLSNLPAQQELQKTAPKKLPLLSKLELQFYEQKAYRFYQMHLLLDEDLVEKGRDSLEFLQQAESVGDILATEFDLSKFPKLPDCLNANIPILAYIASPHTPEILAQKLDLPISRFQHFNPQ